MLDLGGLIKPGTVVRMTKSKPGGKTSHAVQLVQVLETECSVTRCCINSLKTIPFLGSAALRASSKDSICFCRLPLFSWQYLVLTLSPISKYPFIVHNILREIKVSYFQHVLLVSSN